MKVYRIIHTIEKFLPIGKEEVRRYFSDLSKANQVFEALTPCINYSNDEWLSLDEVEIINTDGEYLEHETAVLRYFSDDTKIGVNFSVEPSSK